MDGRELKTGKGKRFAALIQKGNPFRWHLDIVVSRYGGKGKKDGSLSARDEFILAYMRNLFGAVRAAVKDIRGEVRIYEIPRKER